MKTIETYGNNQVVFRKQVKQPRIATQRKRAVEALDNPASVVEIEPIKPISNTPIQVRPGREKAAVAGFMDDERTAQFGSYVLQGLPPVEAGILANFSKDEINDLEKRSAPYRIFVQKKLIQFKQKHLKVITANPDVKTSQWLLQKMFPDEFEKKATAPLDGGGSNAMTVIQAIVKTVQMTPDSPVKIAHKDVTNTNSKEEQDDASPEDCLPAKTSTESGGANII